MSTQHTVYPNLVAELVEAKQMLSRGNLKKFPEKKIGIVGSFTLDYLPPFLFRALQSLNIYADIYSSDFNQWTQELLDDKSGLYAFQPDIAILVADLEDLFPELYQSSLFDRDSQYKVVEKKLWLLRSLVSRFLQVMPSSSLYVVVPTINRLPHETIVETTESVRGREALESFLSGVRDLGRINRRILCVDWDFHVRQFGAAQYRNNRLWYLARMRLNLKGYKSLADLLAYYYQISNFPPCKLVVVDLDNTLWGGIAGEDGINNIVVGHEGVGLAYRDFQNELLRLRDLGILLAICSKNDAHVVWEVFDKRPEMVLKRDHFSTYRINWVDKMENIQSIASELSIGLQSIIFLDDDPFQRTAVRSRLPVLVPDLPEDPTDRPSFLRQLSTLHRLELTEEDKIRGQLYQQKYKREQMKAQYASLEDFLASLKQEAIFLLLSKETIIRAAQLCQKTNQFNLTTKRYSPGDLETMINNDRVEAYTLSLKDIFGDNGIVGFAVLNFLDQVCEIDTLLMSCRVLGRKVEDCFLAFLVERARTRNIESVLGRYIPTEKNVQTASFYRRHGFSTTKEDPSLFLFDLTQRSIEYPNELKVISHEA